MNSRRVLGSLAIGTLAVVPHMMAAAPQNTGLACVPASGRARVEKAAPEGAVAMRFYFRETARAEEYYVEMMPGRDARYWAVTPKVSSEARALVYRFVAVSASGAETLLPGGTAEVSASCPAVALNAEEDLFASNLVLGRSGTESTLQGFSCEGIVAEISAAGKLQASGCGPATEASVESAPPATGQASRGAVVRAGASRGGDRRVLSRSRP
jgi:hypothetical protein